MEMETNMKKLMMLLMVALAMNVQAGVKIIPASEVPKAVMDAAKQACSEGTLHQAELDVGKDSSVYEIEMMVGDKTCDMKFRTDGSVVEIEREVDLTAMPKKVQQTLALYTNIKIIKAEHVQKGSHVFYEAEAEFDGHVYGFEIAEDGKILHQKLEK